MASWQHDPALNYSYNLLQGTGKQQYDTGKDVSAKGLQTFDAPADYYRKLLSGDMSDLMGAIGPQADVISQQFGQVRRMLGDQPRGGGKTSQLAELPVEHIRQLTNLITGSRQGAAQGLTNIAGAETQAGLQQTQLGMQAAGQAAGIAEQGRQADIANSWKTFFKQLGVSAVGGLAGGAGAEIMNLLLPPKKA